MMTVSSLNAKIKSLLEATFMHVTVEGEVSSATYHGSGHLYFTLKDDESTLRCVMWRSNVAKTKFHIEAGMHLVVHGSVGVYVPRGEYQLYAVSMEPYGQGALALAFEQLKKKLEAKGYFDTARKKRLPKFPKHIVLVTAEGGAALQDMLKVIRKRWELLRVTVVDTPVQGEGAAQKIAEALRYADTLGADIVVTGRGGGSTEDLWAFNEEVVADAIFAMQTPVVSAVGHEVDTLISDFVADMRAPTPSAAMEMILPDRDEMLYYLDEMSVGYDERIERLFAFKFDKAKHLLSLLHSYAPMKQLVNLLEYAESLKKQLTFTIEQYFLRKSVNLPSLQREYETFFDTVFSAKEKQLRLYEQRLLQLNPRAGHKKGWARIFKRGKVVSLSELALREEFTIEDAETIVRAKCLSKKTV